MKIFERAKRLYACDVNGFSVSQPDKINCREWAAKKSPFSLSAACFFSGPGAQHLTSVDTEMRVFVGQMSECRLKECLEEAALRRTETFIHQRASPCLLLPTQKAAAEDEREERS